MSWPGKFGQASGLRRDFQGDGDGESAGQAGPPRRPGVAADLSVVHAPFKSDGEPTDAEVNDADIYKGFLCRMRGLDSNLPPNLQLKALESGPWWRCWDQIDDKVSFFSLHKNTGYIPAQWEKKKRKDKIHFRHLPAVTYRITHHQLKCPLSRTYLTVAKTLIRRKGVNGCKERHTSHHSICVGVTQDF